MAVLKRGGGGDGAVALVTGGSRGIGHEVARRLAERGLRVVVTSRKRRPAEAAAREIGGGAVGHPFEASDSDSIRALAAFVKREVGRLDVLVNNAAVLLGEGGGILTIPEKNWSYLFFSLRMSSSSLSSSSSCLMAMSWLKRRQLQYGGNHYG